MPYRERHACWYRSFFADKCADCGEPRPYLASDSFKSYAAGAVFGMLVAAVVVTSFEALILLF